MQRDVTGQTAQLTPARGGEVLLHCDDSYAFAAGLLAIAHVGARAVLFTSGTTGEGRRDQKEAPEYLSVARSERTLQKRVRIPWDLASLDGHFPGAPIVAGVAQLHFAVRALEELLGEEPALGSLEALKFHDVLLPGQEALLRVELQDQGRFQFSLRDAERPERSFASGRGHLEPRR